jgi:hypothetical protein
MRAEVPSSFGFAPEGLCCQQIVQMNATSDRDGGVGGLGVGLKSGELGNSLCGVGLPGEEEHASVLGVGGSYILQRR